ncbi:patatin-like phospholipase family protein [Thalassotalea sp. PLHSN55]|uniref:patatin-like phospholipase family protein n=1 Tax=Thalassotalea sp. PLHSN55 TaxID=3435888 RepID=UPI003F8435B4
MIEIYAGKTALKTIQEHGFKQELFTSFLGASGGPKWFTLFGLDKYLFGDFFAQRTTPLNIVGSSAGAFRAACFAQKDPVAAIETLAKNYSETVYSANATPQEITFKARQLLDTVFGDTGVAEIIDNPIFKAHFIVAKTKGLTSSENKLLQGAGLLTSYILNRLNRKLLSSQYHRYVYQPQSSNLVINDPYGFDTEHVNFTENNLKDALLASGAIPMVMQGIKNIADSPKGMYRDGGIIDYHFDFKVKNSGLVLYPHFNAKPKAGWFDKNLSRKVSADNYDNVVMICPTQAWIEALPYGKIPDRTDFTSMEPAQRIKYWQQVFVETETLAQSLDDFIHQRRAITIKSFN